VGELSPVTKSDASKLAGIIVSAETGIIGTNVTILLENKRNMIPTIIEI
jgi:hypothetical protein